MHINVFAKFYEIPSLPFQDIEKPKCRGLTNARMDGQCENSIPPTPQTQFAGGINMTLWRETETQHLRNFGVKRISTKL